MNSVILIGRLAKDPEMKTISGSDNAVCNFTLAVDRPFSKEKKADFLRVICFGKTAENCERFLSKGSQAAISGRIQTGSYTDKNGEVRYSTDIIADRVEFVGGRATREEAAEPVVEGFATMDIDEDCPF